MSPPPHRLVEALSDRYRIERELGQGGMATVWLAEDLRHERKVALKVLRPELAAVLGAERFVREIKTTAALQHPHILPLYDSGSTGERDGGTEFLYYVMPYVEGETLRRKLDRETQLGVEEAVRIAAEVADALDYAHRHGVIHRDIKPENILLHDGRSIVADFGIALAVSAAAGGRMTETGLSLGTPHYMSPEQATAEKEITSRSDVYSLASVLYEMLAGQPPHLGGSAQQIIMKIIAEPVAAVTTLRRSVPPNVAAALAKALEKLPADRFGSAREFAEALHSPAFTVAGASVGDAAPPSSRSKMPLTALAAIAIVAIVLAAWGWLRPGPPAVVLRYGLALPADKMLLDVRENTFALGPDGSIVYVGPGRTPGDRQLWVKHPDQYEPTPLAGTDGARTPVVSPDGQWIMFWAGTGLHRMPMSGAAPTMVADSVWQFGGNSVWLGDGTVAYADYRGRLRRVAVAGGAAAIVYDATDSSRGALPTGALPDGRGILFKKCDLGCATISELWVADLRSREAHRLFPQVAWAGYLDGLLVYVRLDGSVFAVPFDPGELAPRGTPVLIFDGVQVDGPYADVTMSASGSIAWLAGAAKTAERLEAVWVSRDGRAVPVDTSWTFTNPTLGHGWSLSPDGTRLAIGLQVAGNIDIWIKYLDNGPLRPLTMNPGVDWRPRWTPDGRGVIYISNRAGGPDAYVHAADGTAADSLLLDLGGNILVAQIAPDGWIIAETGAAGKRDLIAMRPGVDTLRFLSEPYNEMQPALSPDGHWLAYVSDESGRDEVIVRPFPNLADNSWQVSTHGGSSPVWSHSGRELFFENEAREMVSQEVVPGPVFRPGAQRVLFTIGSAYRMEALMTDFDVSPDDQRFLMVRATSPETHSATSTLNVAENWIQDVKRMVREGQ